MQKVEGSSPFIRSHESPAPAGLSRSRRGTSANLLPRLSPRSADVTGARAGMNDPRPRTSSAPPPAGVAGTPARYRAWTRADSDTRITARPRVPTRIERSGFVTAKKRFSGAAPAAPARPKRQSRSDVWPLLSLGSKTATLIGSSGVPGASIRMEASSATTSHVNPAPAEPTAALAPTAQ
jgi:hypothetical protein